jgi:hypothetical protein
VENPVLLLYPVRTIRFGLRLTGGSLTQTPPSHLGGGFDRLDVELVDGETLQVTQRVRSSSGPFLVAFTTLVYAVTITSGLGGFPDHPERLAAAIPVAVLVRLMLGYARARTPAPLLGWLHARGFGAQRFELPNEHGSPTRDTAVEHR